MMKTVLVYSALLVLFAVFQSISNVKTEFSFDPDIKRNVSELILSKGYPVENHVVQTKDGYLLSVQRIPYGKNGDKVPSQQVVFLQHGILASSSDWVINFPEQSLGFILADAGYDVWMGNSRGNTYSRRHIKYTPDMEVFWDFSFDQLAEYDFPAMIDYVLNKTGHEQLFFIGHSQGTSGTFAMLSESLEYNKKIKLFVALAPVTTLEHMTSVVKYLVPFQTPVEFALEILGVKELAPSSVLTEYLSEYVCDTEAKFLCKYTMFLIFGADPQQLNETRLGVYTAHKPAGTSVKSVIHYAQLYSSKKFTKFDYGTNNVIHYNQTTPPEYDLSKITAPVALLWSLNDAFADPEDVVVLQPKLKSLVSSYCVSLPSFNHEDFVIALDANRLVYDEVMKLLKQYK